MIDVRRFLDAVAHVESANGANDYPRFEPAYAPAGGRWVIQGRLVEGTGRAFTPVAQARWARYGMASACSYSRWQILYHSAADLGYDGPPPELWSDASLALTWVTRYIDRQLARGVETVEQLADAYNSGNAFDAIVPVGYIAKVVQVYDGLQNGLP